MIISDKHGVNASIELCTLCGESLGIVLFGKLPNDEEAPREVCLGHVCEKCIESLEKEGFVVFFEVSDNVTGRYIKVPKDCFDENSKIETINYVSNIVFEEMCNLPKSKE